MRRAFVGFASALLIFQTLAFGQAAPTAAPASRTLYTSAVLVVHATASATGTKVTSLSAGTKLTIGKCANSWCQVLDAGKRGYVAERYLSATPPAATAGKGYTNSRGAHVPSPTTTEIMEE